MLLPPCALRLTRKAGERRWEWVNVTAEPRSAYLLSGLVQTEWEHGIPPVEALLNHIPQPARMLTAALTPRLPSNIFPALPSFWSRPNRSKAGRR
jgi:hypothetical protein